MSVISLLLLQRFITSSSWRFKGVKPELVELPGHLVHLINTDNSDDDSDGVEFLGEEHNPTVRIEKVFDNCTSTRCKRRGRILNVKMSISESVRA